MCHFCCHQHVFRPYPCYFLCILTHHIHLLSYASQHSVDGNIQYITLATKIMRVLATGTSILAGPSADIQTLAQQVGATPTPVNPNECTFDCSTISSLPTITIVMSSQSFNLTGADYVINVQNVECLFGFTGMDVPASRGPLLDYG